jgi:hypothetical protein
MSLGCKNMESGAIFAATLVLRRRPACHAITSGDSNECAKDGDYLPILGQLRRLKNCSYHLK